MTEPRTLVVGDVHGCADELDDLLRASGFARGDRLVLVGDLVAKGPDSAGVVSRVRELGGLSVVGNHEVPVIAWERARRDGAPSPKVKRVHELVAEALSPSDHDWLGILPSYLALPGFGALVVHAGFDPSVPLSAQRPDVMANVRSIRDDGTPSRRLEDGKPWAGVWQGPEHVIFGHDAVRKAQHYPHATGLDTGCVYGGELTAIELPTMRLFRVPARREWCPF